jgi:hypothetical protein
MSAEEEKEQPGQDAEARETGAEKKEKKYWPAALALMLLVLAGGGYYALTGLDETAQKLGSGSDYARLAANSGVYDGSAGQGGRGNDFFPLDEEGARKAAYKVEDDARLDRMNPAVIRAQGGLAAGASGASGISPDIPQPLQAVHESKGIPGQQQQAGEMAEKLKNRAYLPGGPGGARSRAQSAGSTAAPFEGSGALAGRASLQRETSQAKPKQGAKGGVMDSLKGAFRATFYGARLSSQDSARSWVARAFDASPEASTAIEYDEKMRSKLDRVNPDSIPSFLRDQDVSAAEAKRLATADPGKPKLDKDGTYDALKSDSEYQKSKLATDFGSTMLNGMFAGISGTGNEKPEEPPNTEIFSDPQDETDFNSLGLGEYLESTGNGEECGCSASAPCCCLPQDYLPRSRSKAAPPAPCTGRSCPTIPAPRLSMPAATPVSAVLWSAGLFRAPPFASTEYK